MKKIIVVAMLVFSLVFVVNINAEIIYDKVITEYDSFQEETTYTYHTKDIKNLFASSFFRSNTRNVTPNNHYGIFFVNKSKNWELLNQQSRNIYFKIDGKLHKFKYRLKTSIRKGYVLEFVRVPLEKDFVIFIANSKETLIRIGCCKDTSINQKYKIGMKEILSK